MGGISPVLYRLVVPADMPKYTRVSKLLAAAHIFTNSCENSKNLSRLLSVLSLSRKFVFDHCCCPKSAIILTVSKMEAILDFWRGYQNLSKIQWGGEGCERGGVLVSAPVPAQAMRAQVARATQLLTPFLLSVQCLFPPISPFSVSQRLDSSR